MKKSAILFSILFLITLQSNLLGFDWAGKNITVVETKKSDNKNFITLKDAEGRAFTVSYIDEISEASGAKILELKSKFYSWKILTIKSIIFSVSDKLIQINIIPSKFECKGTDILQYLPGGMLLFYTDSLEYNFRITKDNFFIRIKGQFIDENQLCSKINEAIKNPHAYIRKRDPEYFLAKLDLLETKLDKLEVENSRLRYAVLMFQNKGFFGGITHIKKETIHKVIELKKQNPQITKDKIEKQLKKEKIKISTKEISLILNIYFNKFE